MDFLIEPASSVGVVQVRTRRLESGEWKNHRFTITPDDDLDAGYPVAPGTYAPLPDYVKSACSLFFADSAVQLAWEATQAAAASAGV